MNRFLIFNSVELILVFPFKIYRECNNILSQRKWENLNSKLHFESGVRMGMGTFNLMISLLPGRVIKLLEFIGFSGNKV